MNRNLGYINRAIGYFRGKPGHQFVLVFKDDIEIIDDSHKPETVRAMVERADFLGLLSKAPVTRWTGQIPRTRGEGVQYTNEHPSIQTGVTALRLVHAELAEENVRYAADPVYALETELKDHDWTGWASDDASVGNAADQHWKKIEQLLSKVDKATGEALVAKYRK